MKTRIVVMAMSGWLAVGVGVVTAQTTLSSAQRAVIAKQVAKMGPESQKDINSWTDAKKLVEFFCKEPAKAELKKKYKAANKVFFGDTEEAIKNFKVEGNTRVAGTGTFQDGSTWHNMTFDCRFDPANATLKSFSYTLAK